MAGVSGSLKQDHLIHIQIMLNIQGVSLGEMSSKLKDLGLLKMNADKLGEYRKNMRKEMGL
jgi:hypothetical protein